MLKLSAVEPATDAAIQTKKSKKKKKKEKMDQGR